MNYILDMLGFVFEKILHSWPLFLVTLPLAAAVRLSGAGEVLGSVMRRRPIPAILLGTAIGALSPLCSCSVIPVVTGLLISGVPLAPVMSFWLASPSMDPEIFFLSVSTIGWNLAVWRLSGTFLMSLGAGFITHLLSLRGWLPASVLKRHQQPAAVSPSPGTNSGALNPQAAPAHPASPAVSSAPAGLTPAAPGKLGVPRAIPLRVLPREVSSLAANPVLTNTSESAPEACACRTAPPSGPKVHLGASASILTKWRYRYLNREFLTRLGKESLEILWWIGKFMLIAFFLEALITLYLPSTWVTGPLGTQSPYSIFIGLGLGLPLYTTSLSALGIVGGLLTKGMSGGAALAFLVAGATTTIPAMTAVWGVAKKRVFALYLGFTVLGALLTALLYQLTGGL